ASLCLLYFVFMIAATPTSPLFPYTTLFRSGGADQSHRAAEGEQHRRRACFLPDRSAARTPRAAAAACGELQLLGGQRLDGHGVRSEEHTSELQSRVDLVCRLLLEKKNT